MKIGVDKSGKVWLYGDSVPEEWNRIALNVISLNESQREEYLNALAAKPESIVFSEGRFQVTAGAQKTYAEKRREAYNARGVTIEAICEALIENAGNRPQKLLSLMAIRDAVVAEFPKS